MGIYDTLNQEHTVVLTHVSTSLIPLLTGTIASVAVHGKSKAHKSGDARGIDEYVGVEEDDICFEVNHLYKTLSPLDTTMRNTNGMVFNYAIIIGAHDLLGTPDLQCAESDGLHVFRTDGKPMAIDLNQVPFKLMIHQQDRGAFEKLLTHQSCWADALKKMTPVERDAFFNDMIHEIPGARYVEKGFPAGDSTSYLSDPVVLASLAPNSPAGMPLSLADGRKPMKTFNARIYGMDGGSAVRRPLVASVPPMEQRVVEKGAGFYGQLHNVARVMVTQAKLTDQIQRTNSPMFRSFSQQLQSSQQGLNQRLIELSLKTSTPSVSRSIPHALSMIINSELPRVFPESYIEPPSTEGVPEHAARERLVTYEFELQQRKNALRTPATHVLPIPDWPVLAAAPGLCIAHAEDYSTEEGCTALWSHLYWTVAPSYVAAQHASMPANAVLDDLLGPVGADVHRMLEIQMTSPSITAMENVLGPLDESTRTSITLEAAEQKTPVFEDAGSFSM
jgi:hypothetical protein